MAAVNYHLGNFPPKNLQWEKLIHHLGPAHAAVARFDGLLAALPNPRLLLSPLTTQEAVISSRIEGTQATMAEVLEFEAKGGSGDFSEEKKNDIKEIINYRQGMAFAVQNMGRLPICQRLIKEVHKILLDSVRGKNRAPGEFRKIQNWLGPMGCSLKEARYIPISAEKLPAGLSAWEKYLHSEDQPDKLVQLAVLHAEFEALHPFLDGNGRLGRMVITLYMYEAGLITSPMFYISAFFDAHRDEYYERLLNVSKKADWTGWCEYFLKAVKMQAEENERKTTAILAFYEKLKNRIPQETHSHYSFKALDWIFGNPIFNSSHFIDSSGIPAPTARRFLVVLKEQMKLLKVIKPASGRSPAVYAVSELLNIAEGRKVF